MSKQETCKTCGSPAIAGMYYCSTCLLMPVSMSQGLSPTGQQSVTFQPGSRIDRFEILESLGVGGFSEVYSVCDCDSPNRPPIAIKVMRMGLNSDEFLSRFEQEHLILRRFEDPGIVRVFESGITEDGRPYFVMEQIDGLRITDYCASENLSLESRVELFIDVCRAVHHAHQKGIIHRDLKPANILVTYHDGVSVPCVIDFGLAKAVESWNESSQIKPSDAWVTGLGVTMGTPGYISPEQADGTEDTDTLSDAFSLGVVLYELVAQHPPWPHETWKRIPHSKWSDYKRDNAPAKPSSFGLLYTQARRIDDDLDTICRKALATDRDQRYESVSQLATDLRYWLRGDPILARPPSLAYRIRKLTSRYRWQSATLVASLCACLLAAVFGVTLALRERRYSAKLAIERSAAIEAKSLATESKELAIRERTVAQHSAYASSIHLATIQIANGQPYQAQQILNTTQSSLRGWEWSYLQSLVPRSVLSVSTGLEGPISVGVSQNRQFAVVSDARSISRIDLKSSAKPTPSAIQRNVQHIAISDDGQYIATLTHQSSSSIKVYQTTQPDGRNDANPLTEVWSFPVHGDSSLAWESGSQSPSLIVVEGNGSEPAPWSVRRMRAATGEVLAKTEVKRWKLADKGLLVGRSFAIVRCSFDRLAVLRLSDFSIVGYIHGYPNNLIEDFEFNSDESRVAFSQGDTVFEAEWEQPEADVAMIEPNQSLRTLFEIDSQYGEIHRINRTSDNRWMAISDTHCIVEGEVPVPLPVKTETKLVSLLDGTYATILPHGDFEIRREIQDLVGNRFTSRTVLPEPEGRRVVISPSSEYCLYQTWARENVFQCSLVNDAYSVIQETPENSKLEWARLPAFHHDGSAIVATPSKQNDHHPSSELAILRRTDESVENKPLPIDSTPWSAAASPDGERLFVGTMRGVAAIDWQSCTLLKEWPLANGPFVVMPMVDNSGVFAIGKDHLVHQLQLGSERVVSNRIIGDGPGIVPANCDYCPNEQLLAISESSDVSIFALGEPHTKIERIPVEASVTSIRFSTDGKRLAIATSNRKIAIWDWRGKHRLIELTTRGTCSSMDFSRDGRWLVNTDYGPCLTIR